MCKKSGLVISSKSYVHLAYVKVMLASISILFQVTRLEAAHGHHLYYNNKVTGGIMGCAFSGSSE